MISIDTETTGIWFTHGCQTFAIGINDGTNQQIWSVPVNPISRNRAYEFSDKDKKDIREEFDNADFVAMHNSGFDLKALVNIGVINEEEPDYPEFWNKIIDTTILSHLHKNTDPRSLKDLSRLYLDTEYESEKYLNVLVNKCRLFVKRRRPQWQTASAKVAQLKPASKTNKWWKCDMWLPLAVSREFKIKEITDYGMDKTELENILPYYLTEDCENTHTLAESMLASVIADYGEDCIGMLDINNQIRHVIWKMERKGTPVHKTELNDAIMVCSNYMMKLRECIKIIVGKTNIEDANWNITPDKLRVILYDHYKLPVFKSTKSEKNPKPSTDAEALIKLKEYCINNLSINPKLSEVNQLLTYIIALNKYEKKHGYLASYRNCSIDGSVYPSYNIVGTDTLRMSAQNPSPQTVSKIVNPFEDQDSFEDVSALLEESPPLRSVFGPKTGRWWLSNDYSQLQLRIFAVVTGEEEMIEAFDKGWDAHDYTARRVFGLTDKAAPSKLQRRIAKNVNFGFIFGAQPKKIESTAGMKGLWDTVCAMFPNAHAFIEETKTLLKSGGVIQTLGGYPLDVPMQFNKWRGVEEKAAHAAVCYIVQGSEGVIVKRAMRQCDDYLTQHYPEGRIVMQVHDEISFDMPERFPKKHASAIKDIMEEAAAYYGVKAPVNCEIVKHGWHKGIEIKL